MSLSEKFIPALEKRIPELASAAVKQAYVKALASGRGVLEVKDGKLIESHADGTERAIKTLAPPTMVAPGKRRIVRR